MSNARSLDIVNTLAPFVDDCSLFANTPSQNISLVLEGPGELRQARDLLLDGWASLADFTGDERVP
jgi:hypothetical protein